MSKKNAILSCRIDLEIKKDLITASKRNCHSLSNFVESAPIGVLSKDLQKSVTSHLGLRPPFINIAHNIAQKSVAKGHV